MSINLNFYLVPLKQVAINSQVTLFLELPLVSFFHNCISSSFWRIIFAKKMEMH